MKHQVTLRPLELIDAPAIAQQIATRKVLDNLRNNIPWPYEEKHAIEFIERVQRDERSLIRAICLDNELVGICGAHAARDVYANSCELGYWLAVEHWGKGIVSETVRQMIDLAFKNLTINRLYASVYEFNPASRRVLEKNGFVYEGTARKAVTRNGKQWDQHNFSILREEWENK